jgi:hypothetical protein
MVHSYGNETDLSDTPPHVVFSASFVLPRREDKDVYCSVKGIWERQCPREDSPPMGCLSPSQAIWKVIVAIFLVPHRNKTPSADGSSWSHRAEGSEHTPPPHKPSHQPKQSAEFDSKTTETRCGDTNLQSRHPGGRSRRKEFKVFLHYSVTLRLAWVAGNSVSMEEQHNI